MDKRQNFLRKFYGARPSENSPSGRVSVPETRPLGSEKEPFMLTFMVPFQSAVLGLLGCPMRCIWTPTKPASS